MKHFVVYKTATGAIDRFGDCPDDLMEIQAGTGERVIEHIWKNETHVIDGVPVRIEPPSPPPPTPAEIAAADELKFMRDVFEKMAKAFFNHENRLRGLEGKTAITWEQFKTAIRGLI